MLLYNEVQKAISSYSMFVGLTDENVEVKLAMEVAHTSQCFGTGGYEEVLVNGFRREKYEKEERSYHEDV